MHRDHQQPSGSRSRRHDRREWGHLGDQEHQMEAREHARLPGKARRAHIVRSEEAERQIRELRVRY